VGRLSRKMTRSPSAAGLRWVMTLALLSDAATSGAVVGVPSENLTPAASGRVDSAVADRLFAPQRFRRNNSGRGGVSHPGAGRRRLEHLGEEATLTVSWASRGSRALTAPQSRRRATPSVAGFSCDRRKTIEHPPAAAG